MWIKYLLMYYNSLQKILGFFIVNKYALKWNRQGENVLPGACTDCYGRKLNILLTKWFITICREGLVFPTTLIQLIYSNYVASPSSSFTYTQRIEDEIQFENVNTGEKLFK